MTHKDFKNVDEQLIHLKNKGLIIEDEEKAKAFLSLVSYYRLSGYWFVFKKDDTGAFIDGTSFESIRRLYEFDYKLRLLISEASKSLEISLRTQFSYHLAEFDSPAALEDPNNFHANSINYYQNIGELGRLIKQQEDKACVKHHLKVRNQRPPIWANVEIMTFGLLSRFLKDIRHSKVKKEIAKIFGISSQMLISFVEHAVVLRNLSAHHARLWNATLKIRIKLQVRQHLTFLYDNLDLEKDEGGNYSNRIYNSLIVFAHIQDTLYPELNWSLRLKELVADYPEIDFSQMGFPTDWEHLSFWKS